MTIMSDALYVWKRLPAKRKDVGNGYAYASEARQFILGDEPHLTAVADALMVLAEERRNPELARARAEESERGIAGIEKMQRDQTKPAPLAVDDIVFTAPPAPVEQPAPLEWSALSLFDLAEVPDPLAPLRALFPAPAKPTGRAKRAHVGEAETEARDALRAIFAVSGGYTAHARCNSVTEAEAEARELNRGLKISKHWRTMKGNY